MRKNVLNHLKISLLTVIVNLCCCPSYAQTPVTQWALPLGSSGAETATGIAHDEDGNSYIIGSLLGAATVQLSDNSNLSLSSAGSSDIFIAKVNANGKYVWVKVIGSSGADVGQKIKVDNEGNIIAIGQFTGMVNFNVGGSTTLKNLTSKGSEDVFALKIDTDGELIWAKSFGGSSIDYALDVDNLDNIYVAGRFQGTANFDTESEGATIMSAGGNDAYILKLTSLGEFTWVKRFGGAGWDVVNGIAVDASQNVFVTGRFSETANFNTDPEGTVQNVTAVYQDGFILKLNSVGNFIWNRVLSSNSSSNDVWGNDIAVDKAGNVFATGFFKGSVKFNQTGSDILISGGDRDAYSVKISSGGVLEWSKGVGKNSDDRGEGVFVDGNGDVYITGKFAQNDVSFGNSITLSASGQFDVFITKISNSGTTIWAQRLGGTTAELGAGYTAGNDWGYGISVDLSGNVHTTGVFGNGATFDFPAKTIKYISAGGNDVFIHKLSQTGFTLPVELSKFNVQKQSGGNKLVWETLSEANNSHFELERSLDGLIFTTIKSINGKGSSKELSSYNYIDTDINYPTIYYRLKQVDFNGASHYSTIQFVKNNLIKGLDLIIYPNPVAEKLIVKSYTSFNNASLKVINATGKVLLEKNDVRGHEIIVDISAHATGIYILEVNDAGNKIIRKFLKL
jgi:hypothetical protein